MPDKEADLRSWLFGRVDNLRIGNKMNILSSKMMECRDIYLDEVSKEIDRYKLKQMQKISMQNFNDLEVRPELYEDGRLKPNNDHLDEVDARKQVEQIDKKLKDLEKPEVDLHLGKWQRRLIKLESKATAKNMVALVILVSLFSFYILPYLLYTFHTFDRHYFGFFNEREPLLALTTSQKEYYTSKNIDFKTIEDINKERREQ